MSGRINRGRRCHGHSAGVFVRRMLTVIGTKPVRKIGELLNAAPPKMREEVASAE